MDPPPEVTVVIPTRNRWRYLAETLAGALSQERVDLEVVVIVDGSMDETSTRLAVLDEPRLTVIEHERTRGVPAARNAGLRAARGEWLAPLDDDDLWAPGKLRCQLDAAARVNASFAWCEAVIVDERGGMLEPDQPAPDPFELPGAMLESNRIPGGASNLIARTELVRSLGGFDERARFDDWDLYIRLAAAARGARCDAPLVGYRRHPQNRLATDRGDLGDALEYLAVKHRALSLEHGCDFDRVRFTRNLAWSRRRAGRRVEAARIYLGAARRHRTPGDLVRAAAVLLFDWNLHRPQRRPAGPAWLRHRHGVPPQDAGEDASPGGVSPGRAPS